MTREAVPPLFLGDGALVGVGKEMAEGGEGVVYAVGADLVAKLYHQPPDSQKVAKLEAMAQSSTPRLTKVTAWPQGVLYDAQEQPRGFLMRRVNRHSDLHVLYGPKTRLLHYPDATSAFLVHVAANLARAFAVVHDHGHVVGDVNQGGIAVAKDGTVALVDCDSFQVVSSGVVYGCDVGVPHYQPPELQNTTSFRGLPRTVEHDRFGIAVLIFQTLFLARHPFAGRWDGADGEMTLERAIAERRFVYGKNAAQQQMHAPPGSLPLRTVSDEMGALFERAFTGSAEQRPTAREWIAGCDRFAAELRTCSSNAAHAHAPLVAACPLCALENRAGLSLFHAPQQAAAAGLDVDALTAELVALQAALHVPGPLVLRGLGPAASSISIGDDRLVADRMRVDALEEQVTRVNDACAAWPARRQNWEVVRGIGVAVAGGLSVATAALAVMVGPVAVAAAAAAAVAAVSVVAAKPGSLEDLERERDRLWQERSAANASLTSSLTQVNAARAAANELWRLRSEAQAIIDALELIREDTTLKTLLSQAEARHLRATEGCAAAAVAALARFDRDAEARQLREHLDHFIIDDDGPRIFERTRTLLMAAGIESAFDLESTSLARLVPEAVAQELLAWRRSLIAGWRFNPRDPSLRRAREELRRELNVTAARAAATLQQSIAALRLHADGVGGTIEQGLRDLRRLQVEAEGVTRRR